MTFISYAQNFEDVMLWRALKDIDKGFYIDVGANDPLIDSVTHAFYERGWRGINIEPVSQWFKKLEQERPHDINLQIAAGIVDGELEFHEVIDTGLSTISEATAKRHKAEGNFDYIKLTVPTKTLTEVCHEFDITEINFLKIDVEGAEKQVLEGLDLSTIRPWIILVEATLPNLQTTNHKDWEWILLEANYNFVYFDGLNRFYISKEQKKLSKHFCSPPNVFDAFQAHRHVAADVKCERLSKQLQEKTKTLKAQAITLTEQQSRANTLQLEWDAAKRHLEQLSHDLGSSQSHNTQLSKELQEKTKTLKGQTVTLTEQRSRADTLQLEWDAAKRRLEQLSNELEEKTDALKNQTITLTEQQSRADTLQLEWNTVKRRLEQLSHDFGSSQSHNTQLSKELEEKTDALKSQTITLTEQQSRADTLQLEWDAAKQHLEQLSNELASSQSHNVEISKELKEKTGAFKAQENTLLEQHQQLDDLNHSYQNLQLLVEQMKNEIQGVYRSKSWRLTWPLRKLMQLVKWLFRLLVGLSYWVFRLPKRVVRRLLVESMACVLKHPRLKIWCKAQLRNYPGFELKLRRLALARDLLPIQMPSAEMPTRQTPGAEMPVQSVTELTESDEGTVVAPDLSSLSFTARRIYADIQTKKAQYERNL